MGGGFWGYVEIVWRWVNGGSTSKKLFSFKSLTNAFSYQNNCPSLPNYETSVGPRLIDGSDD